MGIRRRLDNALRGLAGLDPAPTPVPAPEVTAQYDPELLRGATALVTGAGANIGRAVALEMARHGAHVVAVDSDAERLAAVSEELVAMAALAGSYHADVSDPLAVDEFVAAMRDAGVSVDTLVNNVGIGDNVHRLADLDVEHWQKLFGTNVFGPLHLTKRLVATMIEEGREGSVLFVTSIHQQVPSRNPAYSTTKAALGMIVAELATELSRSGIRVNALAPGWTTEQSGPPAPRRNEFVLLGASPIPPRYIGRAAVYLSAEFFSRYTTGTVLTVDAGISLYSYRTAELPPTKEK